MLNRTIICINCGTTGEIEVNGLNADDRSSRIFRHLGHNPFSGHLHYQCPSCEIVLLVDPMSILGMANLSLPNCQAPRKMSRRWQRGSIIKRLMQDQQAGES